MLYQLIEGARRGEVVAACLWAGSGLLLLWGTRHKASNTSDWGLYLSAAAAACTVRAGIDRNTTRVVATLTRGPQHAPQPASGPDQAEVHPLHQVPRRDGAGNLATSHH